MIHLMPLSPFLFSIYARVGSSKTKLRRQRSALSVGWNWCPICWCNSYWSRRIWNKRSGRKLIIIWICLCYFKSQQQLYLAEFYSFLYRFLKTSLQWCTLKHWNASTKSPYNTCWSSAQIGCSTSNNAYEVKFGTFFFSDEHLRLTIYFYIIKQTKLVSLCVCPAMRFVVLWRIELKLSRVEGHGHQRFMVNFSKWPDQRSKVIQWSNCFKKCPVATTFGGKNPWPKCNAFLGQRSSRGRSGQPGVKLLRNV